MQEQVMRTIAKRELILPGETIVVAVSGGPDSLSLLHLLHKLTPQLGITLHVVHINHCLRPEAPAEALAVKKWALQLGLPITVRRLHVGALQRKEQLSLQDAARQGRYRVFLQIAQRVGATRIATAHHRDDRVETLLLRLLSGSGLDGLKGIPSKRALAPGIEIIRPLYDVSRQEIEVYCHQQQLLPLQDPSNAKPTYLRNRVRLHLLPYLEKEFGLHIRRSLTRTTNLLAEDSSLLTHLTDDAYSEVSSVSAKGEIMIQLDSLLLKPAALQARIIRQALWHAGAKRIGLVHVRQVLAVATSKRPAAWCRVPGKIMAHREYNYLSIGPIMSEEAGECSCVPLQVPGRTYLPWSGQWLEANMISYGEVSLPLSGKDEAYCAADNLRAPLHVRTRQPGDRVQLFGSSGERKVKKIFIDKKIPQCERDKVPLVICGENIVWLGGIDIAEQYRITPTTRKVLHVKVKADE